MSRMSSASTPALPVWSGCPESYRWPVTGVFVSEATCGVVAATAAIATAPWREGDTRDEARPSQTGRAAKLMSVREMASSFSHCSLASRTLAATSSARGTVPADNEK
jgi:hypothetical protein